MTAVIMIVAILLAALYVRRKLRRSRAAHGANVAALRPLAEFDARFPRSRPRAGGRYMR